MQNIQQRLFELRDEKYAAFQSSLTPSVPPECFIGVRVPMVRQLAKELVKNNEYESFLQEQHKYYDENMLHGLIVSEIKDYDKCLEAVEAFLPYVDNWAICDTMSPKVFKKHKKELLEKIKEWTCSDKTYTCRFGIQMLMNHYLDSDFSAELLEIPAGVRSKEYYVNMMIAWFYATALAKQWDDTVPYIVNQRFDKWVHNKTIQKACESRRITDEQKAFLKYLKK